MASHDASKSITGVYITQHNIMFEWDDIVSSSGWYTKIKKKYKTQVVKKLYVSHNSNSIVSPKEMKEYQQEVEEEIMLYNYDDTIRVILETFECSNAIYETVRNFFVHMKGYEIISDYIPNNYIIFVKKTGSY